MRRTVILLTALACLALPSLAAAKGQILYSVTTGDLVVGGVAGAPRLSVPAKADLHWFADRPARRAGVGTAADLAAGWVANRFDRVAPSAAVVTSKAGRTMQTIVTLQDPVVRDGRVSFAYTVIPSGKAMGMQTTGRPSMGRYRGELFVDDAAIPPCTAALPTTGSTTCIAAPGTTYGVAAPSRSTAGTSSTAVAGCSPDGGPATATIREASGTNGDVSNNPTFGVSVPGCSAAAPIELDTSSLQLVCRHSGKRFPVCDQYVTSFSFTVSAPIRIATTSTS